MAAQAQALDAALDAVRASPAAVTRLEQVVFAITARTLARLYPATPPFGKELP